VTGHADLVQAQDGSWWMVCLGVRPVGYHACHHLGRETFLAPVVWDADGWPVVGDSGMIALEMPGPTLRSCPWPKRPVRDDFDRPELGMEWNSIRNPVSGHRSLTERPGWLTLHGPAADLNNMQPSPCWVGRRQEHFHCRASALFDFVPARAGEEAGLTVFQNYRHHYEIALARLRGKRSVIVRRRIGSLQAVVAVAAVGEEPVVLSTVADPATYRFSWSHPAGVDTLIAEGETRYLSTEVGGRFTGVYFAMYATGGGKPCSAPAGCDWFDYEILDR
jgi:alpha-N-arabinofuranosidase